MAAITIPAHRLRQLQSEIVADLAASIAVQGLLQPIVVSVERRERYRLIAGRHRLEAMRRLGHDAIDARIVSGIDAMAAELMEIDENLIRADLSPAERALHVGRRKELYELQHPETRKGATPGKRGKGKGGKSPKSGLIPPAFIDEAAAKTGKGRTTVAREAQRAAKIPNLDQVVGTSLDQGDELDALAKLPVEVQAPLISQARIGKRVSAKGAAKNLRRQDRERELGEKTRAALQRLGELPRHPVLYVDLPWPWESWSRETGMDRAPMYPTMPLESIRALAVPAAADCVLFLWATVPLLDEAIQVMKTWGFTYKSQIIWDKERMGTGFWARIQHEVLLIGTRGDIPAPAPGTQPSSVIRAKPGAHSEKPDIFALIIEGMFPTLPKLEMFARKQRQGWTCWGNEVEP
ncbi:MAG TPA: MT-A70 family methyltransferase [Dongiaceae bacterium]|nr:MT-A70 family methyltransferase [Dongiaceae bacterium]